MNYFSRPKLFLHSYMTSLQDPTTSRYYHWCRSAFSSPREFDSREPALPGLSHITNNTTHHASALSPSERYSLCIYVCVSERVYYGVSARPSIRDRDRRKTSTKQWKPSVFVRVRIVCFQNLRYTRNVGTLVSCSTTANARRGPSALPTRSSWPFTLVRARNTGCPKSDSKIEISKESNKIFSNSTTPR